MAVFSFDCNPAVIEQWVDKGALAEETDGNKNSVGIEGGVAVGAKDEAVGNVDVADADGKKYFVQ